MEEFYNLFRIVILLLVLWHRLSSPYHNLLRLHIIAIDEAQNIHTRGHPRCRNAPCASVNRNDDTPRHVNHLNRSLAVNDDVVVTDESEILIVAVCIPADGREH